MTLSRAQHLAAAIARLAGVYQDKPTILAFLKAVATQVAALDASLADLYELRSLETAEGAQLDILGRVLDESRGGLGDEAYRAKLQLKLIRIHSEGTPRNLIQIWELLTVPQGLEYREIFPASVQMFAFEPDSPYTDTDISKAMNSARAAGVALSLIHTNGLPAFATAEYSGPWTVAGLATEAEPTSGGTLATNY